MKRVLSWIHSSIISQLTLRKAVIFLALAAVFVLAVIGFSQPVSNNVLQIVSIVTTLFSALMIVTELHAGKQANKAERLIELNNYFHDNEGLMLMCDALENDKNNGLGAPNFAKVGIVNFAAYCSYFENLGFLINKNVANISDIDDLFGYRFFLMMHCPYIQESNILPHSSSWQKMFELYDIWIRYRKSQYHEGDYGKYTAREEYRFTEKYLKEKLYMYDKGYIPEKVEVHLPNLPSLTARTLLFADLQDFLALEDIAFPKDLGRDAFFPLDRSESIESIHKHHCVGLFEGDTLVAACVLVSDDATDRSLSVATNMKDLLPQDVLTFDFVVVHPDWRRMGIHHAFIDYAIAYAKRKRKGVILAVTSPRNLASKKNFVSAGFNIINPSLSLYGGERVLMRYDIQ